MKKKLYLIYGPTASGKSLFANKLASNIDGAIINADSMQLYDALEIISASPSLEDKKLYPHFLYNFLDPKIKYNISSYISVAQHAINQAINNNVAPIIVGGTGMYINGLLEGISEIPKISDEVRESVLELIEKNGTNYVYNLLEKYSPESILKLSPNDSQRIARNYEVFLQTGKSIREFQNNKSKSVLSDFELKIIYLKPSREFLYHNCNTRFLSMINSGAINEVKIFISKYPNIDYGITNALGYQEIKDYINGIINLEEAITLAQTKTRNYAKRQFTWFNNQMKNFEKEIIEYSSYNEFYSLTSSYNHFI